MNIFYERCFFIFLLAFSSSSLWSFGAYGWHDQQRIAQLMLLLVSGLLVAVVRVRSPKKPIVVFTFIFFIGGVSACWSEWPVWAFKEWSRIVGLFLVFLLVGTLAQYDRFQKVVFFIIAMVGVLQSLQFLIFYMSALSSDMRILDAGVLLGGFSNPRFFGQFQVLIMPLMAFLVVFCFGSGRLAWAVILFFSLSVHWCISLVLGGRGLWLGVLLGQVLMVWIARRFWILGALQITAAILGGILYYLLFFGFEDFFGLSVSVNDGLRFGLSMREIIWIEAWEMFVTNPWLGVGPMHFSAEVNPIAAHPHQMILQWAAEWGGAVAMLATIMMVVGMVKFGRRLKEGEAQYEDAGLFSALTGALVLAQVDGVFVMPYVETWLAILAGLSLARYEKFKSVGAKIKGVIFMLSIFVVVWLAYILVVDAPSLLEAEKNYMKEHVGGWFPRFWEQGWIPMDIK